MEAPTDFTPPSPGMVWLLLWSLYGLKQAVHEWYLEMKMEFGWIGWKQTDADYAVFTQHDDHGISILGSHVDDVMLATPKPSLTKQKDDLLRMFDMQYMGDLHWYTGIHDRTRCTITISQEAYTHEILDRFNMANA